MVEAIALTVWREKAKTGKRNDGIWIVEKIAAAYNSLSLVVSQCIAAKDGLLTMETSPNLRPWHARWAAVRLLEQAVSKLILGPRRSKNQLSRFESMAVPVPVAMYLRSISGSLPTMLSYSRVKHPICTEVLEPTAFDIGIPAMNRS